MEGKRKQAGGGGRSPTTPESEATLEGRRVGAYRVLRVIGRGGMGTVYLAERVDEYRQQVALKVMASGPMGGELEERFRRERQILARLSHPNIARILDGGMTEDGRPYLVMRYVEGLPITEHCDAEGLGIRRRLALFRVVCEAVHFAHRNLVVHLDLKPSNILVRGDGQVTLLDFGIARLLGHEEAGSGGPNTKAASRGEPRLLTPGHAAPEQVVEGPVTTATDTWALGVLLYELLTHRKPFLTGGGRLDLERAICEEDPPSLSAAARRGGRHVAKAGVPRSWSRRLEGDLDTIVRHALRKEPGSRYPSPEELGDDVLRYLTARPIRVRPDSFGYRAGRFLRRNPWQTAAALAFAAFLTASAVTHRIQSRALQLQRDAARVERDVSQQVTGVLVGIFQMTDPTVTPGIRSMTLDQLLETQSEKAIRGLDGQEEVQARLRKMLGRAHRAHHQVERGRELLRDALEQRRRITGWEDPEALEMLHELATLEARVGDPIHGERLLRHSLDLHRSVFGEGDPRVSQCLRDLAEVLPPESHERALILDEARGLPGTS